MDNNNNSNQITNVYNNFPSSLSPPQFYLSEEKKQTAILPEITCVKNSDASEYE